MGNFKDKHGPDAKVAPDLEALVRENSPEGKLACAVAFDLAGKTGLEPSQVGRAADILGIHLVKCQLGLFGHSPEKKKVRPAKEVSPELESAVSGALENGRLSCAAAWNLAEKTGLGKMKISAACEALGVKVKPCQLGAF